MNFTTIMLILYVLSQFLLVAIVNSARNRLIKLNATLKVLSVLAQTEIEELKLLCLSEERVEELIAKNNREKNFAANTNN